MADSLKGDLWKAAKHPRTRPWLAVAAELPASLAAHAAWGDSPPAAVGLTVAAGVLTAATWWAGSGTRIARRMHATASTAAGSGYLVVATVTDPLTPGLLSTLIMGGTVAAGSWNIRQALRADPDAAKQGGEKTASETGVLVKAIGEARAKLRKKPEVEPNKVVAPLQLAGGDITTDELGNRIKHIAGELGVSPTSIRILPDPDRADRGDLVIVPQDMLRQPTDWPGPSSMGGSITEPVVIGRYEDGADAVLWFPADEESGRNATHFLTAGMNGSGKSAGVSVGITEVLTRRDVIVWATDPSKGQQTFGPFLPYLDWCEMSLAGGEAMIAVLSRVITARADALGRNGFKNWTAEAFIRLGMPYMVVWIEEAAKFFREGAEMEGLVMEARSAGISVIVSLQRPSSTSMPTDVREQLGGVICFGVKGATTADMALPEDVRDAGARPEAWENRRPGYAYLVAPGVDEDRYTTPLRTYRADDDAIGGALAIAPRPPADRITTTAAGEAYANRTRYSEPLASPHEAVVVSAEEDQDVERDAVMEQLVAREAMDIAGLDDDGTPDLEVDPDREIPAVPADQLWRFAPPVDDDQEFPELSTSEAEAELLVLLDEFRAQDRESLGPKDFAPFWGKAGRLNRSRAWLSPRLAELAEVGLHLAETDEPGVYRLLYPEPADA
ncbi:plasmid transfer protein TraB [Streptomyces sp. B6B3]|uniref:plasmid transfer protein TraB n=1 Tax=Streptomyces sp. B6B3 TaxID=3153570 RepID=UPI00325CDE3D